MRRKNIIILFVFIAPLLFINCSEVTDKISQPEDLEGVHPDGFGKLGSDNFHSFKIQAQNWSMTTCQKCHAVDYSGGLTNVTCLDCHTSEAGPEACNTCHGVFADETRIAPPTDLNNNFETSAKGVGAHTTHIYENSLSLSISCNECHPSNESGSINYISSHIDGLPAEIQFGDIATLESDSTEYSFSNLSCSNTYCHGNFEYGNVKGNKFMPIWNLVDGTQAACGTCHGELDIEGNLVTPLPEGHFGNATINECINCHPTAFNYYNSEQDFEFNTSNHINGEKNLD